METAILHYDFTVICGYRDEVDQNAAFNSGHSRVKFPNSHHNKYPSRAIDIAPWPIDWDDTISFYKQAAYILEVAGQLGIKLRWGGNWGIRKVCRLTDLPHFQEVL